MEESTKAQQKTIEALRAQSDATLAAARISALAILIPHMQQRIDKARADWAIGRDSDEHRILPRLEHEQGRYITLLGNLLEELLKKSE